MENMISGNVIYEKIGGRYCLSKHQCEQLAEYNELLFQRNKEINLTGFKTRKEILQNMVIDSLSIRDIGVLPAQGGKLVDVGSGGGIPGIVIKIAYPSMEVCLIDASRKKVDFIQSSLELLALQGAVAVCARSEVLAHQKGYRENFSLSCTRALSRLSAALELTVPFIQTGGKAIYYKGPRYTEECEEAKNAFQTLGCRVHNVVSVPLPGMQRKNIFVIVHKYIPTPAKFPRKTGTPGKRPL